MLYVKDSDSGAILPEFKSQHTHLLGIRPQASYLSSLSFSLLIGTKVGWS